MGEMRRGVLEVGEKRRGVGKGSIGDNAVYVCCCCCFDFCFLLLFFVCFFVLFFSTVRGSFADIHFLKANTVK